MRATLERAAQAVAAALFGLLFAIFVVQVAARFLFDSPLAWSDEFVVVLYIAFVFWSAALLLKERDHVMFDLVYAAFPPAGQRVIALVGAVLMVVLMGWLLPHAFDYVRFMHREPTAVMGIPFSYVFAPFVLFVAAVALRYLHKAWRLLGRDWERQL